MTHNKMHAGGVADNSGPWNDEKDPFEVIQRYAPSAGFEYNILEIFHLTIQDAECNILKLSGLQVKWIWPTNGIKFASHNNPPRV